MSVVNDSLAVRVTRQPRIGRIRLGYSLIKDRQVPLHIKVFALTLGACLTVMLIAFEVPLEGLVTLLMPLLGIPFDFALDGVELAILPFVFALWVLPWLARGS